MHTTTSLLIALVAATTSYASPLKSTSKRQSEGSTACSFKGISAPSSFNLEAFTANGTGTYLSLESSTTQPSTHVLVPTSQADASTFSLTSDNRLSTTLHQEHWESVAPVEGQVLTFEGSPSGSDGGVDVFDAECDGQETAVVTTLSAMEGPNADTAWAICQKEVVYIGGSASPAPGCVAVSLRLENIPAGQPS